MNARTTPGYDPQSDMSDWPGSPLSTLHSATATTQPIRREEYVSDGRYVIRFELPGIDPDDLDVSVEAKVLTVHAERRVSTGAKYHSEFRYGLFCSHVTLPADVDAGDVTATYRNGILEVSVGLQSKHAAHKVKVVTTDAGE
jgi:HSP20 family protein